MFRYQRYIEKQYDRVYPQILCGRGVKEEDVYRWIAANPEMITPWEFLDDDYQMTKAVNEVRETIDNNDDILVVVDSDADGFTSAAIFINYIYKLNPVYAVNHIDYFVHEGKQHGLADVPFNDKYRLIVCPDSASNDYEQHKIWRDNGKFVIILDHHEAPYISQDAITVNNQLCDYPNKDLSGAGITWQFCRAYDFYYEENYADELIDLAALGNISDMMDYRSLEIRALVCLGLSQIVNPFFSKMVEYNEYSINKMGGINYFSIAFYVTPFINSVVRSGTPEEKELLFKSMLLQFADVQVPNGKRGHKGEYIDLPSEAVRQTANVKTRQTKLVDETMNFLKKKIETEKLNTNPVMILLCEPGEVETNIAGLVANKLQSLYQRPTFVLIKTYDFESKSYIYKGSARNYSMSEVKNLRELSEQTGSIEYAQGHEGAFGFAIKENDLDAFASLLFNNYKDVSLEPTYYVDYIWNEHTVDPGTILTIAGLGELWGTGIPESYVALEQIFLKDCLITLLGMDKGHPTIKITLPNGVDIMKFKSSEEEFHSLADNNDNLRLYAVCKPQKNEWNEIITPQLIIEDYYLKEEWVF